MIRAQSYFIPMCIDIHVWEIGDLSWRIPCDKVVAEKSSLCALGSTSAEFDTLFGAHYLCIQNLPVLVSSEVY